MKNISKSNSKFKLLAALLVVVLLGVFLLAACENTDANEETAQGDTTGETTSLSGKIMIVGSTSVQPLAEKLADEFNKEHPDLRIDIQGVGSTAGVKAANDGTCDIGTASRALKSEEESWGLTENIIALDGIAVVVNPANKVQDLQNEDVLKIFTGEINNWKDLGGEDKEIIVVSREAGSGTRGAFEELMKLEKKVEGKTVSLVVDNALIAEGNGAVLANVAGKESSIGYMSLGMVDESKVKKVKINGVEATVQNIKSQSYPIARPFLMLTKDEPTQETQAFLEFILSNGGQKVVAEDYIPVN